MATNGARPLQWENIPAELRALPQWVCAGENKVPIDPKTGRNASHSDPKTWGTYEQAVAAGYLHIGFVFTEGDPYTFIDLDRTPDEGQRKRHALIYDSFPSYAEESQSGKGAHIIVRGSVPHGVKRDKVEVYSSQRYAICTGWVMREAPIVDCQAQLTLLFHEMGGNEGNGTGEHVDVRSTVTDPELLQRAREAANGEKFDKLHRGEWKELGYKSQSEADLAFIGMLCFYSRDNAQVRRLFLDSALGERDKAQRGKYVDRTIAKIRRAEPPGIDRAGLDEEFAKLLGERVSLEDFWAYHPQNNFIFVPTGQPWPAASVNAKLPPVRTGEADPETGEEITAAPATWLKLHQAVDQMTWYPGYPQIIENRLIHDGGWIDRQGVRMFNLYKPPLFLEGRVDLAGPWIQHVHTVFPENAAYIIAWLAHRVQRPHEKVNHALVLIGDQGTGKDTIVAGVIHAVGPWNVQEVSPDQLMGRFNSYLKSVLLRISEARDLGDTDRYRLYERTKTLIAAPPDVLRCDEKNLREHMVPNLCGVVITSNHVDGVYLPADDRRHFVAATELTKESFPADYFRNLYRWYENGGYGHVAAYLRELDLSGFHAKAPPPKTPAFWTVVNVGRAPEDAELADVLDGLGFPVAVTLKDIIDAAGEGSFGLWLRDRRNAKAISHRMTAAGYVAVRNPNSTTDGRWRVGGKQNGKNVVIYAKRELTREAQIVAAQGKIKQVYDSLAPWQKQQQSPGSPPPWEAK